MNISAPSRLSRIVVRTGTILFFIFCVPGLAHAQWEPASTGSNDIHNTNSGNVGIGTASPTLKLHVVGNSTPDTDPVALAVSDPTNGNERITLGYDITNHWGTIQAINTGVAVKPLLLNPRGGTVGIGYVNAGATAALAVNGNVGIGTTSPGATLDVAGNIRGRNQIIAGNQTGSQLLGTWGSIGGTTPLFNAGITGITNGFQITPDASNNIIYSFSGGNVIIGAPASNASLDVNGSINVSGNINAKYQDVAEWVPSTQVLSAATVVILDPEQSTRVIASTSAYDTRVAGVISARPGLALGEAGPGKTLVATTGRVKVKADATSAPIRMGDLLVTSDIPGMAMRSEPLDLGGAKIHRPGTIIGKALEPLEKGTGEILVLLSLQ